MPDKKDFYAFQRNIKTKREIERNIEIIGEAVNIIIKANPEFPIKNARKIIGHKKQNNSRA